MNTIQKKNIKCVKGKTKSLYDSLSPSPFNPRFNISIFVLNSEELLNLKIFYAV